MAPLDAVVRLEKSLFTMEQRISQERTGEFTRELDDIAVRLERTTEVLARVLRLNRPQGPLRSVPLTPRELEVFGYLAMGLTNGEIAAKCWVSENTVKFHVKNIFRKLDVRDRGQAMMIARSTRPASK